MNIVGHQNIIKFLERSIANNKLAHAYLFYGPENVGKGTVATDFVIGLFTKDIKKSDCSKIKNQIIKRTHPDIYWLEKAEDKKNISIEQTRELQSFLNLKPFSGLYKTAIINRAEEMSQGAANSFLKILEEPPPKSIIILLVNNLKALPPTIISRCQLIKFNPVPLQEIKKFLTVVYKLSSTETEILLRLSFGRPGLIIKFLNEINQIKEYQHHLIDFLKILNSSLKKKIDFVNQYSENIPFLVWQIALRDLLMVKNNLQPINIDLNNKIKLITDLWSESRIYQALKLINKTKRLIELNINKKLALENLIINI